MTPEESRTLFLRQPHAILATADASGVPHLVPVVFAEISGGLALVVDGKPKRTTDLKRLRNIAANPHVSLLAEHYDADWTALWWARADGTAEIHHEIGRPAAELLGLKYSQYQDRPPAGPWVVIRVDRWSGWSAA